MDDAHPGSDALAQIDKAIADRPLRDGKTLKAAVQSLAAFRDRTIVRHREDGGTRWRRPLEHINAVLTVVMAAEFPNGEVPWDELAKARDWLAGVLADDARQ